MNCMNRFITCVVPTLPDKYVIYAGHEDLSMACPLVSKTAAIWLSIQKYNTRDEFCQSMQHHMYMYIVYFHHHRIIFWLHVR